MMQSKLFGGFKFLLLVHKMRLKDIVIGIGSFILGCIITLNFLSLGLNDKPNVISSDLEISVKNAKNIKLFSAINYFLIIVIVSAADNFVQRAAIRNSWGMWSKDYTDVQYFFIIGSSGLPSDKISKLQKEQIKYNDLFLLSISDNYKTLTKKVLQAFVWFESEFNYKYILKCDDDSFVLIPKVVDELKNKLIKYEDLYWGYFDGRAHVKQVGKWKEKNWFLCDRYLPYALGGGYVLSRSLVHYIKENERLLGQYLSEDVSVGVWLSPLNITRKHDVRFDTEYLSRGCNNSYLVTHKQTPENMKELYSNIVNTGKLCENEKKTRKFYDYNWKVLPSKCCVPEELKDQTKS
ncbi:beta-1,3-galactosyltransferase 6-like [Macrosteles quadrilineatus]|uniref:beta-1,3-galactosyltransferase 6-like n=1 Tax=Macrosteles quadrilineatus TaxID=74068 RepID=UPI0023E258DA|nr:beta-1,3-galactosyltransferase 6-like [Macrosteles quadrilineatus]